MKKSSQSPMSPLARAIYKQLRRRVTETTRGPQLQDAKLRSITYAELAVELGRQPTPIPTHPRSSKLHAALGEVARACRAANLPCLPAIVWRRDTHRPSEGYYAVAHPRARSRKARVEAWEREHNLVIENIGRFPAVLP